MRGGGIAFIVHEDITMTRLDLAAPPSETRLETLWLNVTAADGRSAIIGGVYRPPDGAATSEISALQSQLLEICRLGKPWYIPPGRHQSGPVATRET